MASGEPPPASSRDEPAPPPSEVAIPLSGTSLTGHADNTAAGGLPRAGGVSGTAIDDAIAARDVRLARASDAREVRRARASDAREVRRAPTDEPPAGRSPPRGRDAATALHPRSSEPHAQPERRVTRSSGTASAPASPTRARSPAGDLARAPASSHERGRRAPLTAAAPHAAPLAPRLASTVGFNDNPIFADDAPPALARPTVATLAELSDAPARGRDSLLGDDNDFTERFDRWAPLVTPADDEQLDGTPLGAADSAQALRNPGAELGAQERYKGARSARRNKSKDPGNRLRRSRGASSDDESRSPSRDPSRDGSSRSQSPANDRGRADDGSRERRRDGDGRDRRRRSRKTPHARRRHSGEGVSSDEDSDSERGRSRRRSRSRGLYTLPAQLKRVPQFDFDPLHNPVQRALCLHAFVETLDATCNSIKLTASARELQCLLAPKPLSTLSMFISAKGVPARKISLEDSMMAILAVAAPGYKTALVEDMHSCAQGAYEGAFATLLRYHAYRKALKLALDPRDSLLRLRGTVAADLRQRLSLYDGLRQPVDIATLLMWAAEWDGRAAAADAPRPTLRPTRTWQRRNANTSRDVNAFNSASGDGAATVLNHEPINHSALGNSLVPYAGGAGGFAPAGPGGAYGGRGGGWGRNAGGGVHSGGRGGGRTGAGAAPTAASSFLNAVAGPTAYGHYAQQQFAPQQFAPHPFAPSFAPPPTAAPYAWQGHVEDLPKN